MFHNNIDFYLEYPTLQSMTNNNNNNFLLINDDAYFKYKISKKININNSFGITISFLYLNNVLFGLLLSNENENDIKILIENNKINFNFKSNIINEDINFINNNWYTLYLYQNNNEDNFFVKVYNKENNLNDDEKIYVKEFNNKLNYDLNLYICHDYLFIYVKHIKILYL